jgi:hypothetical protein
MEAIFASAIKMNERSFDHDALQVDVREANLLSHCFYLLYSWG